MNKCSNEILLSFQYELENTNIYDFYVLSFNRSGKLLIAGTLDFSYYHEVEMIFGLVSFICCPLTTFNISKIRLATTEEVEILLKTYEIDTTGYVIAFDDDALSKSYYIVAEEFEYNFELVKYYDDNGNIIHGEEIISDWAKGKFPY